MRLFAFLVGLLLLLLRHDVLEHRPQSFDLAEFVADLQIQDALVGVSCFLLQNSPVRGRFASRARIFEVGRTVRGSRTNVQQ